MPAIMKKKKWSGAEVGQLLLSGLLTDIKRLQDPTIPPAFTQEEYDQIEQTISNEQDYEIYSIYKSIYAGLLDSYNWCQSELNRFYHGYFRLMNELTECYHANQAFKSLKNTPLIMTESQYQKYYNKAREYKEQTDICFYDLFYSLLWDIKTDLDLKDINLKQDSEDELKDPIYNALTELKKQSALESALASKYNKEEQNGYRELPNGTRNDRATAEEWKQAVIECYIGNVDNLSGDELDEKLKELNEQRRYLVYKLVFEGYNSVKKFYKDKTGKNLLPNNAKELTEDLESYAKDLYFIENKNLEEILPYIDFNNYGAWHLYKDIPQDLTMYDLLNTFINAGNYAFEDKEKIKTLKTFKIEMPNLYEAISEYIKKVVPKARELKKNEVLEPFITVKELAELGLQQYERRAIPDEGDIIQSYIYSVPPATYSDSYLTRAIFNGIAVLKNPSIDQVDKNGDYIQESSPYDYFTDLERLYEDKNKTFIVKTGMPQLIRMALTFLYSFNAFINILEDLYHIKDLYNTARFPTDELETKIYDYNYMIYKLYLNSCGTEEQINKKRAIIKECFVPIDVKDFQPTKAAIEAITKKIKKLKYSRVLENKLRDFSNFLNDLQRKE